MRRIAYPIVAALAVLTLGGRPLANAATLFDDVSFGETGGYIEVAAGSYDLQVRDETGATIVLALPTITLETGRIYAVFATGFLAGNPDLNVLITTDN